MGIVSSRMVAIGGIARARLGCDILESYREWERGGGRGIKPLFHTVVKTLAEPRGEKP